MQGNYSEQYQRILRQLERCRELYITGDQVGIFGGERDSTTRAFDAFRSLFENLHHLKDWIKNDDTTSLQIREVVEDYVSSSSVLSLLADVANASKHRKLNCFVRVNAEAQAKPDYIISGPIGSH